MSPAGHSRRGSMTLTSQPCPADLASPVGTPLQPMPRRLAIAAFRSMMGAAMGELG
jgi:hypothetical protein